MSQNPPVEIDRMPTLNGIPAVVNYCKNVLHVSITPRFAKSEIMARNLVPYRVANRNCFAPADVVAWITAMRTDQVAATGGGRQSATARR